MSTETLVRPTGTAPRRQRERARGAATTPGARARLILFGDLGTLARRSQWQAPIDHLDEFASAWEHRIISRLVGYLNGQGAPLPRIQLCEGLRS